MPSEVRYPKGRTDRRGLTSWLLCWGKTKIKGVRDTDPGITCATDNVTMTWGFAVG